MGISPFRTARDIYYDKLNIAPQENSEENWVALKMGHLLEDLVAEIFSHKTGLEVFQIKRMFQHPLHKFMLADVDYFVSLPDGGTAILEIKTTNYNARSNWWEDAKEIVPPYYSVKEVVLPFHKFPGSDPILGPEMRSTGEVMGTARHFPEAYAKAELASGSRIVREGRVLLSVSNSDKARLPRLGRMLEKAGFEIDATGGTYRCLVEAGIKCTHVKKVYEGRPNILDGIKSGLYTFVVNTTEGRQSVLDSRELRRGALQYHVSYCTTMNAALATMEAITENEFSNVSSLQDLHQKIRSRA